MRGVAAVKRLSRAGVPSRGAFLGQVRTQKTLSIDSLDADVDPRRTTVPIHGRSPIVACDAFVAPSATLIGQVELADRVGVWYNTVLRGDMNPISVGYSTHIKDGSVVSVDASLAAGFDASTVIGCFVNVGARCFLKACTIQNNVTIGDGSVVLEGALIEEGAVLEAGSVVPAGARVPAGEVWGGNPLTFVRKLEREELEAPGAIAKDNGLMADEHRDEFLPFGQGYQSLK